MSSGHWLLDVARRAGLKVDSVSVDPTGSSVADVWESVCAAAGVSAIELARMVTLHFRLELADLDRIDIDAVDLIPGDIARRYGIMPVQEDHHHLIVATADPTDFEGEQAAAFASGRAIDMKVAPPAEIARLHEEFYFERTVDSGAASAMAELDGSVQLVGSGDDVSVDETEAHSEPVVRLTNLLLKEAVDAGASDIHIEPADGGGDVRFRVDGVLRRHMDMPLHALIRVISRVKVMGQLDIADRIRPQDGRARITVNDHPYDLRISTVPARDAEKAVIRILDPGKTAGGLEEVGIPEPELSLIRRICRQPDGILIVTGPTGSGKTTTLYSVLRELATDRVNIMTVEDPVEYQLPGVTQIQIEPRRGVTFANSLRAILRQDPDIIFIGEIRDLETAEIAVQASNTGHLVLSTLHTNDAPSVVQRLLDIGLDGPSIAGSLRAALGQRLVRRLCADCSGTGCASCGSTGYLGRAPVAELMLMDDHVTELVGREAPHMEIRKAALAGKMRPLQEVGLELASRGITDRAEVERVLGETSILEPRLIDFEDPESAGVPNAGIGHGEAADVPPGPLPGLIDTAAPLAAGAGPGPGPAPGPGVTPDIGLELDPFPDPFRVRRPPGGSESARPGTGVHSYSRPGLHAGSGPLRSLRAHRQRPRAGRGRRPGDAHDRSLPPGGRRLRSHRGRRWHGSDSGLGDGPQLPALRP